MVSSDLFYARDIQNTGGIDTAVLCKLVCKSTAQKETTYGLTKWYHNSGATVTALRSSFSVVHKVQQALRLLRVIYDRSLDIV